jgi:hypothetical protein
MPCTAAAEGLAAGALLEGRRGLEADIGEKRLALLQYYPLNTTSISA